MLLIVDVAGVMVKGTLATSTMERRKEKGTLYIQTDPLMRERSARMFLMVRGHTNGKTENSTKEHS